VPRIERFTRRFKDKQTPVYHHQNIKFKAIVRKQPSSDILVFSQIFKRNEYQPLVDMVCRYEGEKKNFNILDAGGNVGFASMYLKNYFPASEIIIVEPAPRNFACMVQNIELNHLANVHSIKGAVWFNNSYLDLNYDFGDKKEWAVRTEESENTTETKGYTVSELMKMYNWNCIDILKIDIEGAEKEIFEHEETEGAFLPVTKYIALEIHDKFNCREQIERCLKKYDFEFFRHGQSTFGRHTKFKSGE
jgi:FkbM family methyltransferase